MAEWPRKPNSPLVHPREAALDSPEDRLAGTSPEDQQRSRGRDAHARYAWREAYEALRDAGRLEPSDLERLGEAAWWTGHLAEAIGAREQAYAARVVDAPRAAAQLAIELARNYYSKGDVSVGAAWLGRAERLLRDQSPCLEEGYLARMQTVVAFEARHDNRAALEYARRALDLATTFGDRDLMAIALHDQGRIMVSLGDVAAGHALMDEATVAAVSGELNPFATAVIYCNTIDTCVSVGDYVRAREWTEGAKRWCDRQAIAGFPGMCRVHRAGILRLRGSWIEAADEAKQASEELREFNARYYAAALEELGTIRLREGDLMGAAEAFRQTRELGREPEPGQSLLYLAEGKPGAALTAIRRALDDPSLDPPHRARLLPACVEIAVAADDLTGAVTAAQELETIARAYGTAALEASAAQARGIVTLARGDARAAAVELRRAAQLWQDANCPYEAARARLTLASAYEGAGDAEASCLELETARSVFERLGAQLDLRRARARLDPLRANSAAALERVTRTFVFTDIVGSTGLIEAIGDEAWTDLRAWHDRTLRSLITRHGGEEVDHAGDGFFVAFATPDSAVCLRSRDPANACGASSEPRVRAKGSDRAPRRAGDPPGGRLRGQGRPRGRADRGGRRGRRDPGQREHARRHDGGFAIGCAHRPSRRAQRAGGGRHRRLARLSSRRE